jgi:hypothetical protein
LKGTKAGMNKGTRDELNERLKKMLDDFDSDQNKQKQPAKPSGKGNIIRRRAGKKEKRFSSPA